MGRGVKMTYLEFRHLPEQSGLELIDGWLVKEPSPRYGHQAVVQYLSVALGSFVKLSGIGRVLVAPFDVVLSPEHTLQPDLLFVSNRRIAIIQDYGLVEAPDLAVEVLSPSSRRNDEGRKRELYFQFGCRELWLIDIDASSIEMCTPSPCGWTSSSFGPTDVLHSRVVRGFELNVSQMLKDAEL